MFTEKKAGNNYTFTYKDKYFGCYFVVVLADRGYEVDNGRALVWVNPPAFMNRGKSKAYYFLSHRRYSSHNTLEEAKNYVIKEAVKYIKEHILPDYAERVKEITTFITGVGV